MTQKQTGSLRVALAGAGMISKHHLIGWQNLGARVQIVAVCDPDPEKAGTRADEFGIPQTYRTLEDLFAAERFDALDVASPRATHAAWVEAAAERGIDVLCQKPMTPTLAESAALVERVEGRCRMMVHENWRFRPWYRELRRWIDAGELGDIMLGQMTMLTSGLLPDARGNRPSLVRQPFMQHEERLIIAEVLIHHLDTMRYLCGELRLVGARAAHTVADVRGETMASILLETTEGFPVQVTGSMVAPGYSPRGPDNLTIIGTRASALFNGTELRLLGPQPRTEIYDPARGYQASFDNTIMHFVDCIESGHPFETGPLDNIETLRLVEHAYLAAASSQGADARPGAR